jgi:predicted acylesterase/phospholipase RssA
MKALVLSGGANKGRYQSAVIKYLLQDLKIDYNIFAGVSVGSLNCSFLAQYEDQVKASNDLETLWNSINNSKIYKSWFPFGPLHAIWKKSIYDSSPLRKLISDNISLEEIRKSGKTVTTGTVSVNSGKYTTFDQTSDYFIQAVQGSCAIPGLMQPVDFIGNSWLDGALKTHSPLETAIKYGADEIDVIMTSPEIRVPFFKEDPNIVDIIIRALDLATDKIMSNDVEKAINYNRLAELGYQGKKKIKLNVIRPKFNLTQDLFDFSPNNLNRMGALGAIDAREQYKIDE